MRKLFWLLWIVVAVQMMAGCMSMRSALDICKADKVCFARMQASSVTAANVVAQIPGANAPLPQLVGALVSLLVGIYGGHALSSAKKKAV